MKKAASTFSRAGEAREKTRYTELSNGTGSVYAHHREERGECVNAEDVGIIIKRAGKEKEAITTFSATIPISRDRTNDGFYAKLCERRK